MAKVCGTCANLKKGNCRECQYNGVKEYRYYCPEIGGYHKETESGCRYYQEAIKPTNTGCFITTAVVDIMGYDDNCYILKTLRMFRDEYLQNNLKYRHILLTYDAIGPQISEHLLNSDQRKIISILITESYLIPICKMIRSCDYEKAIASYIDMIKFLQNQVCVEAYVGDYQYDPTVTQEEMGHGRALVIQNI